MIPKITETENYIEIFPEGFISIDTMEIFENSLSSLIEKNKNVIINFNKTEFIDSSSIGLLIMNLKNFDKKGLKIIFLNLNKSVHETFKIIGIINSLIIPKTHDEAVAIAASRKI